MEKNDIFEFDACGSYEAELPREITEAYDIIECLSVSEGCDTLLIQKKESGQKAVVKCCRRGGYLYEQENQTSLENLCAEVPYFMGEYKNEHYRCIVREYMEGSGK